MREHDGKTAARFAMVFAAILTLVYGIAYVHGAAGQVKTGGTYQILSDSLTAAGETSVTGSTYWLVFSAGQPVGQKDLTGGTYDIEGGHISGFTAVFQVIKTISQVETPAGYAGLPTDRVPGGRLTYKLDFTNYGDAAKDSVIEDRVPSDLTYIANTISLTLNNTPQAQTDGADGDNCAYHSATSSVQCVIPNIAAGATGALIFKTIIK